MGELKSKFKNHKKKWARISKHWENFTEPSRPSRGDIINYNKLLIEALGKKKSPLVLVLGATPEIRDLLYKFSFTKKAKITCVDMTRKMFEAMSNLTDFKIKNERLVLSNWVDMKFKHKFDIIIGDFVNGNIGIEYKDKFFTNLESLLKDTGSFITRDCVFTEKCRITSIEQIFRKFLKQARNEEYSIKKVANLIANSIIWASWTLNKENKTSLLYYWSEIERFGKSLKPAKNEDDIMLKIIYKRMIRAWEPYKLKYWTYTTFKKNEEMLKKYFIIKKRLFADDYGDTLTKASPMYLLAKK
jgi:hypothetical protein